MTNLWFGPLHVKTLQVQTLLVHSCDFDPDNSLARVLIKCYISRVTRSRADPKIFAMCCITHCEKWDQCIRVFQPSMIFIFDNLVPRHLG